MNPHADSVQQPSETLAREILEICRGWSQATFGWQGDDPDGFSKASRAHDEECICRIVAALSRQAPAAPAAVDFEQWWLAEVAANGGVPIGADYKHWAKKGFELRGDARAPVAPVERTYELGQKHEREAWLAATGWDSTPRSLTGALPNAFYKVFGDGVVPTSRDQKMWLAGYYAASTPSSPTQALLGWTRYEKARKLNVAQWAELHQRNLKGERFDDMIDALPATTQPVQQDTRYGTEQYLRGFNDAKAQFATPPAEKQAAPAADQQPSNLEDFREAVRDMEAAALKVENDWRSTDAAVLEAQEKQERAKQLLARIDGARQLPNWRGAKQAAPSGEDNHG